MRNLHTIYFLSHLKAGGDMEKPWKPGRLDIWQRSSLHGMCIFLIQYNYSFSTGKKVTVFYVTFLLFPRWQEHLFSSSQQARMNCKVYFRTFPTISLVPSNVPTGNSTSYFLVNEQTAILLFCFMLVYTAVNTASLLPCVFHDIEHWLTGP